MKKLMSVFVVAIWIGTLAFSAMAEEKITLRILTRFASEAPEDQAIQQLIKQFQQENPNILIEDNSINDESAFNDRFRTGIASGNVPDLFLSYGGATQRERVQNGVFLNLKPALDADKQWADAFMPGLFDLFTYDGIDGVYGIPYKFYAIGLYYNKALFEKQGLKPPTTIKEFETVCDNFLEAGITPLSLGESSVWRGGHLVTNLVMKKFGFGKVKALADRKARYDDPDMIEIFALVDKWNKKGYFGKNAVAINYEDELAAFHKEQSAMHMDGSWYMQHAYTSPIKDKIDLIPFPYFDANPENKDNWMGGVDGGLCLSGTTTGAQQDAAVKFLKYMTSVNAYKYLVTTLKENAGAYTVKMDLDPSVVSPLLMKFYEVIKEAKDFKGDMNSYDPLPQMEDRFRNSIQGIFAGSTPEQAAKEIANEIDQNK